MAAVLSKAGNNSILSSQRVLLDRTGLVAYPSPLWTGCRLQPVWGGMGLGFCPSSLTCLSTGLLLAKSLVPSPHPHPLPYWASQPFMNGPGLGRAAFPPTSRDIFLWEGRWVDSRREKRNRRRGRRGGMACILFNHTAGLGESYLGTQE